MNFLELATEARTCRRFDESKPLTENNLRWLVECARVTPSARNAQELRFILVTHGSVCDRLFSLTRWAGALKDWNGPEKGERPSAFIAVLMPQKGGDLLWADTGMACQTIQLAATSRGWGACVMQSFDHNAAPGLLNVPEEFKIALLVALGVAKEKRVVDEMPIDGSFAYWRDKEQTHHVPKRSIDELILRVVSE